MMNYLCTKRIEKCSGENKENMLYSFLTFPKNSKSDRTLNSKQLFFICVTCAAMIKVGNFFGRLGLITGIGCTVHCFFEYVCDFVVCSGKRARESKIKTCFCNRFFRFSEFLR